MDELKYCIIETKKAWAKKTIVN